MITMPSSEIGHFINDARKLGLEVRAMSLQGKDLDLSNPVSEESYLVYFLDTLAGFSHSAKTMASGLGLEVKVVMSFHVYCNFMTVTWNGEK